jgi:transcriptional repressor NrdR
MICPYCTSNDDKVIDSRASEAGRVIRRRRQCLGCGKRFTTYERVEETTRLMVIKRDGSRVPFSRDNILRGIAIACGKRPVAEEIKLRITEEVEDEIHRTFDREVESREIGEMVAQRLKNVDEIAYVRFASEYYQFRNVGDILKQLEEMNQRVRDVPNQQALFDAAADGTGQATPPRKSGGDSK